MTPLFQANFACGLASARYARSPPLAHTPVPCRIYRNIFTLTVSLAKEVVPAVVGGWLATALVDSLCYV